METPFASALKQILDLPGIAVFDYRCSFATLWSEGMLETSVSTAPGRRLIVIVGTDPAAGAFSTLLPPESPAAIAFAEHFTAYSWAAAYRLRNPDSHATIVLLDLNAPSLARSAASDFRGLYAQEIPRLSSAIPGVFCFFNPRLSRIVEALSALAPEPLGMVEQALLRGIIQQHLRPDPDNHHHFGNVAAALMLTASGDSPTASAHAIAGLLHALQPGTRFQHLTDHKFKVDQTLCAALCKGVPCVLLDDVGCLWKSFICQWVPESLLHISPVTESSRTRLVRRLRVLASEPVQKRQINASDFGVSAIPDGQPFILLLDLRLFSPGQADQELNFVDSLGQLATAVRGAPHLKWPAIGEAEVSDVMSAWTDPQPHKPNYCKARSWLPRLISLVDPTLPIAIFSSTQDQEVLKEFAPYGNIITDFAKPAFRGILGDAEEWIGAAHRSFEKALHATLKIRAAQAKIRTICLPWIAPSSNQSLRSNHSQIEIFLDESGTAGEPRFAVGAVVLISGSAAFDHRLYRNKALLPNGPGLWGLDDVYKFSDPSQFPQGRERLKKGKEIETGVVAKGPDHNALVNVTLSAIQTLITDQNSQLLAFALLSDRHPDPTNVASIRHPFHRYRDMLARLLESVLLHCEPVRSAIESGARICIDAASARNHAGNWGPALLRKNFGAALFDEMNDKGRPVTYCRTLSPGDVLPLVAGILQRNAKDGWANQVDRARAVQLSDFASCTKNTLQKASRMDPKPLHYLADWVAHFAYDSKDWSEVPNIATFRRWFGNGFHQMDGDELLQLLRCHRRWAQSARVVATMDCARIAASPNPSQSALTSHLRIKAARWIEDLSAQELTALFSMENPV